MGEAATTTPAAPAAPATPPASAALAAVPPGAGPEWVNSFQNAETKTYISSKGFKSPEALAESYKNLEVKLSSRPPEDRTIILPEKMEGDSMKDVWQKLGTPKEWKEYGLEKPSYEAEDYVQRTSEMFQKNNLTKSQALGLAKDYNAMVENQLQVVKEARQNAVKQADLALQKEWGAQYEANINIAKQGTKILGMSAQALDIWEAVDGKESVFKTLQKIGVSVGESTFVAGTQAPAESMTPEQAQAQIKTKMQDAKFAKKVSKGDTEALAEWNKLNQAAYPGEKQIG